MWSMLDYLYTAPINSNGGAYRCEAFCLVVGPAPIECIIIMKKCPERNNFNPELAHNFFIILLLFSHWVWMWPWQVHSWVGLMWFWCCWMPTMKTGTSWSLPSSLNMHLSQSVYSTRYSQYTIVYSTRYSSNHSQYTIVSIQYSSNPLYSFRYI